MDTKKSDENLANDSGKLVCDLHLRTVAGMDAKQLARVISDMHYEALSDFLFELSVKIMDDGLKDSKSGRVDLGKNLIRCSEILRVSYMRMVDVWEICKKKGQQ